MVWNLTAVTVIFDLLVMALAISMIIVAAKNRLGAGWTADVRGPACIMSGVLVIGSFCATELATMYLFPSVIGVVRSQMLMEYLHLNLHQPVWSLALGLIFVGFLFVTYDRKSKAKALATLSTKLVYCEEHERRRIADFMHDHVGQSLAALRIKLHMFVENRDRPDQQQSGKQLDELLNSTIKMTESLTYDLNPPVLQAFGLQGAVKWLCEKMREDYEVRFDSVVECDQSDLEKVNELILYRILRELMLNVVKHAKCASAYVTLHCNAKTVSIVVEDSGIGFDRKKLESMNDEPRFGLASVQDRIAALCGIFEVDSRPGEGTRITLAVPMQNTNKPFEQVT